MKKIILCADDYGQSAAISKGILQLVAAGRLSAVGCMTEGKFWRDGENALPNFREQIDIGLHFNLTHPFPAQHFAPRPLNNLLLAALTGTVDTDAIAAALHTQLDHFETVVGHAPDFVDGHQHVHIFPGIRDIVLRLLSQRYTKKKPYLRAINPRLRAGDGVLKLAFLKLLGTGFSAAAQRYGLLTTTGFGGIYSLRAEENFAALMSTWMAAAHNGDLLMCHPGLAERNPEDPIAATRPLEFSFLQSAEFGALLARTDVQLVRFHGVQNPTL